MPHIETLEERLYLLADLGMPKLDCKRHRWRSSEIKILYQIYLGHKNVDREAWVDISPERKTLGKYAHLSESSVKRFICQPYFSIFGEKRERWLKGKQTSNQYRLKQWVYNAFQFFEKMGMMRNFQADFEAWRQTFRLRFFKYVIPKVQEGVSLPQILERKSLVNKFSTTQPLKRPAVDGLKRPATTYPTDSLTTPSGSRSNTEPVDPIFSGMQRSFDVLRNRFLIREGDLVWLMRNVPLKNIDKGIHVGLQWLANGMEIRSPIRTFMGAMKKGMSLR